MVEEKRKQKIPMQKDKIALPYPLGVLTHVILGLRAKA
jgi:hypothetical protein